MAVTIQLSRVLLPVTSLGPGRRVGVWVQGCTLACVGCASQDTWDPADGDTVEVSTLAGDLISGFAADETLTGLTLSGGEPLQQAAALTELVRQVLAGVGRDIDVLIFTGYRLPVARRRAPDLIALADATVVGRYMPDRGFGGPLLGSANQELEILTSLGRHRWAADPPEAQMQVTLDGADLVMSGIPAPGDLDRLRGMLSAAGIELGSASWQT